MQKLTWPPHLDAINIQNLVAFVAVVENGSIQKAADQSNVASDVLRSRVNSLEAALGAALLVRGRKGVTMTAAGEFAYAACQRSLASLKALAIDIPEFARDNPVAGRTRFGITSTLAKSMSPKVLQPLLAEHAHLSMEGLEGDCATLQAWLEEGQIDFAIGLPDISHWWLTDLVVFDDPLVVYSSEPPSTDVGDTVDLDHLKSMKFVWQSLPASIEDFKELAAKDSGQIKVDGATSAIAIVRHNKWRGVASVSAVLSELESGSLGARRVLDARIDTRVKISRHTERSLSVAAQVVADSFVREALDFERRWRLQLSEGCPPAP